MAISGRERERLSVLECLQAAWGLNHVMNRLNDNRHFVRTAEKLMPRKQTAVAAVDQNSEGGSLVLAASLKSRHLVHHTSKPADQMPVNR